MARPTGTIPFAPPAGPGATTLQLRVRHHLAWFSLLLALVALAAANEASAQDQGLDLLLFRSVQEAGAPPIDLEARSVQLYRLPLSLRLRREDEDGWGLRITFPVSLSSLRVEAVSDVSRFVKKLGVAAVVPGVEFELPVGHGLRLRPFAEVGFGKDFEQGRTKVLYGGGTRARFDRSAGRLLLTLGGSAMNRKALTSREGLGAHSTFEGAINAQLPLGFSIGPREARGGVYVIARGFNGLELKREGQESIVLSHQFEVGGSFSTAPDLKIWKVRLPWLAVGYQMSEVVSGVRVYFAFPF